MPKVDSFFQKEITFIRGAHNPGQFPQMAIPEIAFWGRSNVGKSSLINKLFFKKELARTSKTPGRTQEINFFNHSNQLIVADLPGYGFAKVPDKVKQKFYQLFDAYFSSRDQLRMLFLLIDARRGVMEIDEEIMQWLTDLAIPFTIVLTKSDCIKKNALNNMIEQAEAMIKTYTALPTPYPVSAKKNTGILELRKQILALLNS